MVYKSATGNPPFLVQNECETSPFDHQSILMKVHFMGTVLEIVVSNTDFFLLSE